MSQHEQKITNSTGPLSQRQRLIIPGRLFKMIILKHNDIHFVTFAYKSKAGYIAYYFRTVIKQGPNFLPHLPSVGELTNQNIFTGHEIIACIILNENIYFLNNINLYTIYIVCVYIYIYINIRMNII